MILIADSGSTKTDWVILDKKKGTSLKFETLGLNPDVLTEKELHKRVNDSSDLMKFKNDIKEIYFYGAGCSTSEPIKKISRVFNNNFINAESNIYEDILAAVYATTPNTAGIICILGTGSNSCYYDGKKAESLAASIGYTIMDEASGNYFGKKLLRDYFYNQMPTEISAEFENQFNLDVDTIKRKLYQEPNPNMYLASFAKFMLAYKDNPYMYKMIKDGFEEFFKYNISPYVKDEHTIPLHFVGSIAFYFRDILEIVAKENKLEIHTAIRKPIDNLIKYHMSYL